MGVGAYEEGAGVGGFEGWCWVGGGHVCLLAGGRVGGVRLRVWSACRSSLALENQSKDRASYTWS